MSEHIVRVLSSHRAANGFCQTCGWEGPLRWSSREAGIDATRHADDMARAATP